MYKFRDDGSVSILAVNKGVVNDDEWYEEFDDHLEQFSIKLEPMSITLQTSIDRIMEDRDTPIDDFNVNAELGRPVKVAVDCFNQIGGSPFLFQRPENPVCIHCGTRTSFIATLCNDQRKEINILHKMWSAQIIFYICLNCFSLTVIHSS